MKIIDLLYEDAINLNINKMSKIQCINKLVELIDKTGNIINKDEFKNSILARENLSTTGIGRGLAIPHGKTKAVKRASLSVAICKEGIDYDSLDGKPVYLFFMIGVPENSDNLHIEVLSKLSTILMDKDFRDKLIKSTNKAEFLKLVDEKEREKFPVESVKEDSHSNNEYRILAVTACPIGIAHTYMAAESLEKKARELGISMKVETNGSVGVKNALTKEEIEKAECIIIAADKSVDMARFDGKRLINTKVSNGIYKADELIKEAAGGKVSVYNHNNIEIQNSKIKRKNISKVVYGHLMNGVSYMLPFLIIAEMLMSLAFLFNQFNILNLSVSTFLMKIGQLTLNFILPILSGYIAMSIADRQGFIVGFIGGAVINSAIMFSNIFNKDIALISSGFLGAVFVGFMAGYLIIYLKTFLNKLPSILDGIKTILMYPILGTFLISIIIVFVNPIISIINMTISNELNSISVLGKVILGILLGIIMSVDMGGSINKLGYIFGIASIINGNYDIMAAVMIGGMVPPISIALGTTFFKNRFTKIERQSGLKNYVLGLSFISEGAIPFVSSDKVHVLPACIIGSAVSSGLSMLFRCSLKIPHGGIFVIMFINNPLWYMLALLTGSLIGMIILVILKKPLVKYEKIVE